ncbi:MAG: hypothetical protein P1U56_12715 [Saprospiraceae bacterium]|nr:hypothetical protein [Saprospiraceae bacterium]
MMRQLLLVVLSLLFITSAWSRTVFVGLNSKEIVIMEYWKFEDGIGSHEALIYNPTDTVQDIEFRKYHYNTQNWVQRLFSRNKLYQIKGLQSGEYVLYKDFRSNIMDKSSGTIEVHINKKKVGLYGVNIHPKRPDHTCKEGIIINQSVNRGQDLLFEAIYDQLTFDQDTELAVEIKYIDTSFQEMVFPLPGDDNPDSIQMDLIDSNDLMVMKTIVYAFKVFREEELGRLKVAFSNINSKTRLAGFTSNFTSRNAIGFIRFYLPYWLDFNDADRYIES